MKAKAIKIQEVERLKTAFAESSIVVACRFQGIRVEQDVELRRKIRETGAVYRVVPNRLARLAAVDTPASEALAGLKGMTSLVFANDDPVGLLKTLISQAKEYEGFDFRVGVVEGEQLDYQGLEQLSKMPTKSEVQAKILYLLSAPATNLTRQVNAPAESLVGVLNAPARDLVSVLKQAVDQQKFQ